MTTFIITLRRLVMLAAAAVMLPCAAVNAGTFSGNARIEVADSTGGLSWNNTAFTVSCWVRLAIPSGVSLTENMTILINRRTGSDTDNHAYQLRFNLTPGSPGYGNLEFFTKGASGSYLNTLVDRPYLERWYHLAVVRQNEAFTGYVDGRQVFSSTGNVGSSANVDGLSIGGWGGGKYLYGEVQEVAVYQSALDRNFINQYMFTEQPTNNDSGVNLKGYFKLGFSTNATDRLRNLAPAPVPTGTDLATSSGSVEFDETNQAGEQSVFDSRRNGGRDAIAPLSGAFAWNQTAIARPTPGIAFDFRFGYSSANAYGGFKLGNADPYGAGALGAGWRHTFEARIIPSQDFLPHGSIETIGLMTWDGAVETWDADLIDGFPSNYYHTRHSEYRGELYFTNNFCEWRTSDRLIYRFNHPFFGPLTQRGLLVHIRDFNNNVVEIQRNGSGAITQVVDTARGTNRFLYSGSLLTNITFGSWQVNFAYDASNRLVSKSITNTSPAASGIIITNLSTTWQFFYGTNGLLERVMEPRGSTNAFVVYDNYGRKVEQRDGLGRLTKTEYNIPAKRQMRHTDPEGTKLGGNPSNHQWIETYDRKGRILVQEDPLHQKTTYTYDEFGNRTSITQPLGYTTFFGYDNRANVIVQTNALGEVTRWVYHTNSLAGLPHFNKPVMQITLQPPDVSGSTTWTNFYDIEDATGNLRHHRDGLGTLVQYVYTTNGLVATNIDANGHVTRFNYDTNGFLIARTDPANNVTSYAVNEVGWKLAETNALKQVTTFAYDLNGNVVRTVDPLQRTFTKTYDANGNLTSVFDAKSQFTTYAYDAASQRTNMVDRTRTNTWSYIYTARGEVERAINPLPTDNTITNVYDDANRLIRVSDPLGNTVTNVYDANGDVTERIDPLGQRWKKTYDRLNRVIAETDPLGNTRRTKYDVAGRIQEITTPNGYPSLHFYDGRGRLVRWIDAENFPWRYQYDGVGNITNIIDALNGNYTMAYGPRNERTLERNQDGKEWRYTYDELLRLKTQRDPNGITRTLAYDPGGRIESVTFSTGRVNAFAYDDNNNPTVLSRAGSGPPTISQLSYDVLDRVREYTDAFSKKVRYDYDRLGRITLLTYPGGKTLAQGFDALSRLTNQVFQFAAQTTFTNTYAYDKAGRLVRRTYPNGVVQTNAFDDAGRIIGLSYSPLNPQPSTINVALTYAYDRNGNKTASTEKGTLDWPMPTLTDETANYTPSGRLIDRQITQTSTTNPQPSTINYLYDPSGNMTNAVGNGQSWCLKYDEDNRVTTLTWDCNLTARSITNRYDAFGRRIARTSDTTESRYVLDLAGSMERILCDMDGTGAITAWYVHGPDLAFKVDAVGKLTCYHADAMANIISLTDSGATNIAQYAYTPYGRNLPGTNTQPSTLNSQPYTFVGSQGVMEELPGLYFMRARYYSAEAGVFLSTDAVKKIGPGWKPMAYAYAQGNPLSQTDPAGLWPKLLSPSEFACDPELFSDCGPGYTFGEFGRTLGSLEEFDAESKKSEPRTVEDAIGFRQHDRGNLQATLQAPNSYLGAVATLRVNDLKLAARLAIIGSARFATGQSKMGSIDYLMAGLFLTPVPTMLQSLGLPKEGTSVQLNDQRVMAVTYAYQNNTIQATPPSFTTGSSGTTSTGDGGSSGGGNNSFSKASQQVKQTVSNAYNTVTTKVKEAASSAKQAVTNIVKSIGNTISRVFGRGKKK